MTDTNEQIEPQETHADWAYRITEMRRLRAYAHPETGSDRHFAEAARLEAAELTAEAAAARDAGLARYEEIKDMHPWPSEDYTDDKWWTPSAQ